jgi:hypothetical protein
MGRIVNNDVTSGFSGKFGDQIIFRQIGNRTFFSRKGVKTSQSTAAQRDARDLLSSASVYASEALKNPEHTEWYSIMAKVNGFKSARTAAVKDYIAKPEIERVNLKNYRGQTGDVIHIQPKMLLKIERIEVTITRADGTQVESGSAIKNNFSWTYQASVANDEVAGSSVYIVAYDRLGKSCRVTTHL